MLSAYIDDSGNSERPAFVLAGFVSTPPKWEAFSDEWRNILDMNPGVPYFKASEAFGLSGAFHRMPTHLRDEKVMLLAGAIKRHAQFGVVTMINYDTAKRYFLTEKGGMFAAAQFINFVGIVHAIADGSIAYANGQRTTVVLDHGILKGLARKALTGELGWARKRLREYLDWPPIERDDLDALPLQAADMLAWSCRKVAVKLRQQGAMPPIALAAIESLHPLPLQKLIWNAAKLQKMADQIKQSDWYRDGGSAPRRS